MKLPLDVRRIRCQERIQVHLVQLLDLVVDSKQQSDRELSNHQSTRTVFITFPALFLPRNIRGFSRIPPLPGSLPNVLLAVGVVLYRRRVLPFLVLAFRYRAYRIHSSSRESYRRSDYRAGLFYEKKIAPSSSIVQCEEAQSATGRSVPPRSYDVIARESLLRDGQRVLSRFTP